ncbi:hypothetical protein CDAR_538571 [Caerostris darwini]|uniref:Uncharacterized protein n=1 Tax=Caerostris darwini TaxID=1538125 RepID=A0AAV4UCJ1_9ARAC|nr:hypothetical protein CDAR_538571 [Caerostris darwini]
MQEGPNHYGEKRDFQRCCSPLTISYRSLERNLHNHQSKELLPIVAVCVAGDFHHQQDQRNGFRIFYTDTYEGILRDSGDIRSDAWKVCFYLFLAYAFRWH